MGKIFVVIILGLTLISCSVLIMNHSNGNIIKDETDPVVKPDVKADVKYKPRDKYIDTIK